MMGTWTLCLQTENCKSNLIPVAQTRIGKNILYVFCMIYHLAVYRMMNYHGDLLPNKLGLFLVNDMQIYYHKLYRSKVRWNLTIPPKGASEFLFLSSTFFLKSSFLSSSS